MMHGDNFGYGEWFASRVNALLNEYSGNQVILAFVGLSPFQARILTKSDFSVSGMIGLGEESGFYDPDAFRPHKQEVLLKCLSSSDPVAMLYEQLLELRGSFAELYSGKIVVVRNNMFSNGEGYPSPVSDGDLGSFSECEEKVGLANSSLSKYYADVQACGDYYLAIPLWYEYEDDWKVIDLYDGAEIVFDGQSISDDEVVSAGTPAFLSYRLGLSSGDIGQVAIELVEPDEKENRFFGDSIHALAYLASCLDLPVAFRRPSAREYETSDTGLLLPLLKRYWGEKAQFREFRYYSNPDFSNEMRGVTQGVISEYVIQQAEAARNGVSNYKNVFVTAPTGAGKSVLFQLPALYLAQRYKVVTLVIEPLKALMVDQVAGLRKRGVEEVVAINSDIPYQDRLDSYERIRDGRASIIYLSPELLLESSLATILNDRELGLVVIDEAHTVTSWGKDFRPDYWYLGPYLAKLKKSGRYQFPIFCLTATAVYGGRDDVINQTIRDLELGECELFLGNPRRDDIVFDVHLRNKSNFPGPIEDVKTNLTGMWISRAVKNNRHAIVYCPYRSQVETICEAQRNTGSKVLGYHGGIDRDYKKTVERHFKSGSCRVLVSTKAFGMGVDIDDIDAIYHYAPTGNLSDYIQEIGRGGRKIGLTATAAVDFFMQDTRYAEQLYALSRYSQWQLREIMAKLYEVYASQPKAERSQNFLVSPNTFSYLFTDEKDEDRKSNRVKSGLMMISRDLEDRFNFPVLVVRPKMSYAKQYVCISEGDGRSFIERYGSYLKKIVDARSRTDYPIGQKEVKVSDFGSIYELNAGDMWSNEFANLTFADFKRRLFVGEICSGTGKPVVSNRMVLDVSFAEPYDIVVSKVSDFAGALGEALIALQRKGDFTAKDFREELSDRLQSDSLRVNNYSALLNTLVRPVNAEDYTSSIYDFKCIKRINRVQGKPYKQQQDSTFNVISRVRQSAVAGLTQTLAKLRPPDGEQRCRRYINCKSFGSRYALAEILEVLKLAAYTIKGGDNPEIFIRLNDPAKMRALSLDKKYSNNVLRDLNDRHAYSSRVIRGFFSRQMDNEARWDVIEEYFLGNDSYVAQVLGIADDSRDCCAKQKVIRKKSSSQRTGAIALLKDEGIPSDGDRLFRVWKELSSDQRTDNELCDIEKLKPLTRGLHFEAPLKYPKLVIESTGAELHPLLAWRERRVLLFSESRADEYARAKNTNWKCYLLGQGDSITQLPEDIRKKGGAGANSKDARDASGVDNLKLGSQSAN